MCQKNRYTWYIYISSGWSLPSTTIKTTPVPGLVGPVAWHLVTGGLYQNPWQNLGGPLAKGLTFSRLHYLKPPNSNSKGSFGPKGNIKDLPLKKNAPFLVQSYSEKNHRLDWNIMTMFFSEKPLFIRCSLVLGRSLVFLGVCCGSSTNQAAKLTSQAKLDIDSKIQAITNLH